jgi:hypothetical protein
MTNDELLDLFDELTDYTYIYGMEDELIDIIKDKLPKPLKRDEYGNYFVKIGDSKSLFCCHLDTVGKQKLKVNKEYWVEKGNRYVGTDGNTILGADDKTGMVILLNMIDNNVPGMYYFLIGEEIGTVGSSLLYSRKSQMLLSQFDRCVAFDRKEHHSIITRQMGKFCCSDEFADSLIAQFKENGMKYKKDQKGVWTDTALFMGTIPECTNISCGYFDEHSVKERQDLDFMLKLADVTTKIDWENLPVVREPQPMDTPDPEETEEQISDLPLRKLNEIFDEIDNIVYSNVKQFASNGNFFKPEKEMTYFSVKDIAGTNNFSAILHKDGSITFKKGDIITNVLDIEMLRKLNEEELISEILKFEDGYDFEYENNEIVFTYTNKKDRIKKFDNFKNDEI